MSTRNPHSGRQGTKFGPGIPQQQAAATTNGSGQQGEGDDHHHDGSPDFGYDVVWTGQVQAR